MCVTETKRYGSSKSVCDKRTEKDAEQIQNEHHIRNLLVII